MKTKLFALMMFFSLAIVACEEDEESSEYCLNPEASCSDGTEIEASACCTSEDCYWTYNGADYDCDGLDCDEVEEFIVDDACEEEDEISASGLKSGKTNDEIKAELHAVTQRLIAEARAACSGC